MSRLATPLSVLALLGAAVALAACGSSSSGGSSAGTGTSTTAGAAGNQSAAFQKFQDCLKQNGVTLPSRGQRGAGGGYGPPPGGGTGTNGAPPAGGTGTPPAGAPGAGFGANNPKMAAAMKACAKLRPKGSFGAGRRAGGAGGQQNIKAFTPYLTCLKDKGLDVKVSDGFNALRGLKQGDPKVQAALRACQSKIPARPQASSTAPATTGTT